MTRTAARSAPRRPARPKKRVNRQESQARTRQLLLESAAKLVADVGYENASIDLIAMKAGFSKGAFYSNFDTKEEIFLVLLETHSRQDVPEIMGLLEGVKSPTRMIEIISDWAANGTRDPAWGVLALELLRRARHDKTYGVRHEKLFRSQWEGLGRILMKLFPEGRAPAPPDVLGGLVFELAYGASSTFTHRPTVGALVKLALNALYQAYGKRS